MEQLRRHLGSNHGGAWTDLFNRMVARCAELRRGRTPHRDQFTALTNEFGAACGSLVNSMSVLPVSTDGHLGDAWEKTILYSNQRAAKEASTRPGSGVSEMNAPPGDHASDGESSIGTSPSSLDADVEGANDVEQSCGC